MIGERGRLVADLFDELAAEALDESSVFGGDHGDLRCGNAAGSLEIILDLSVSGVVRVANVAFGEPDVFAETAVGVGDTVEDIDDAQVSFVLGRVVLVCGF
jgi:hypothetical protein